MTSTSPAVRRDPPSGIGAGPGADRDPGAPPPSRASPAVARVLLSGDTAGDFLRDHGAAALLAAEALVRAPGPTTGPAADDLEGRLDGVDLKVPLGSTEAALEEAVALYLDDAVYFHHPRYAAHLNCPVAVPAVAAEAWVSSINSSMDTWDQSAGATFIERRLVDWAASLAGLGAGADGIFGSGGTQSNLQALLMARNRAVAALPGPLPERLGGLRVYASQESHFSIVRSASQLGLGEEAVVGIPVDGDHRMDPVALERAIARDLAQGLRPLAVVATAGTTDFGAIDPLAASAGAARAAGAWFHVDAAYGCGLLASPTRRHLLDGIELADSVTVDFHKSFFQPIGSSALLVRDGARFAHITHHADYLNPGRDPASPNQVDKSLQTTRRFDALKLWVTLRSVGHEALGAMFDTTLDLAADAGRQVAACPGLALAAPVHLGMVVFRYEPELDPGPWARGEAPGPAAVDELNDAIRGALYRSGEAMVAATTVAGRRHLKLTLLNPRTTSADVAGILAGIVRHGRALTPAEVTA
ncbi:pyridoxal phosphate-dependent decarboxylase family protein [Citricoccus zhacaiensis]|uniref:pyridoxal phosphate-dependent decarboxylase family protein n=1 Tax=Citricoccus zhacaiensis TaxID=489142 RepID=UPI003CE99B2B